MGSSDSLGAAMSTKPATDLLDPEKMREAMERARLGATEYCGPAPSDKWINPIWMWRALHELNRGWEMFRFLLGFWCARRRYWPAQVEVER